MLGELIAEIILYVMIVLCLMALLKYTFGLIEIILKEIVKIVKFLKNNLFYPIFIRIFNK